ncbi:asialoglycoprotein receptor 1-like [Mya arenaria]|uniref:asialoglycoprotein receptor 1-like n=1 Tax=Mya arenaria TaxID=6604 RepID=UPI0022E3E55F|nr:asialoglycoprotein receptor 1-like [Mya arenaria]
MAFILHTGKGYSTCLDGWIPFNGSCYLFAHHHMQLTFTGAEQYCRQHNNAHLVHVNNALENAFIKDQLREKQTTTWWIGLTDEDIEGVWKWFDTDTVASFTDWHPNEGATNGEDCAIFYSVYDFKWADTYCSHTYLYPPLCETPSYLNHEEVIVG